MEGQANRGRAAAAAASPRLRHSAQQCVLLCACSIISLGCAASLVGSDFLSRTQRSQFGRRTVKGTASAVLPEGLVAHDD